MKLHEIYSTSDETTKGLPMREQVIARLLEIRPDKYTQQHLLGLRDHVILSALINEILYIANNEVDETWDTAFELGVKHEQDSMLSTIITNTNKENK
jgi:hypothetical protein